MNGQPNDTFILRKLWRSERLSWDQVQALDGEALVLAGGRRVRAPAELLSAAVRVLEGPKVSDTLTANAAAFSAALAGPWAPERLAHALLDMAAACGASDVHFEPGAEQVAIRMRVAGELVPFATLGADVAARLTAALKAVSGCLPYRRDLVQEGRIPRPGVTADVRTSFVPTALGERVALRLFGRLLELRALGFEPALAARFEALLGAESGLVLVAGPSGAGKTTTLYAALAAVAARRSGAHLSIEDPVEQRLRVAGVPVDQVELAPERGLTGEAALVAALRQDVDVLAVGEVRTAAEAQLALKAAHTGRLVLAGLHAGSTREARQRLLDLGVEARLLEDTLAGVLHQKLVTRPCEVHDETRCARCHGTGRRRVVEADLWTAPRLAVREVA
jgi:general secretion pathway protein E